jgi:hypothetical protein
VKRLRVPADKRADEDNGILGVETLDVKDHCRLMGVEKAAPGPMLKMNFHRHKPGWFWPFHHDSEDCNSSSSMRLLIASSSLFMALASSLSIFISSSGVMV